MNDHYHLALETPQPHLVEGMRWLLGSTATNAWLAQRLAMGHPSRVCNLIRGKV